MHISTRLDFGKCGWNGSQDCFDAPGLSAEAHGRGDVAHTVCSIDEFGDCPYIATIDRLQIADLSLEDCPVKVGAITLLADVSHGRLV